jgi:bacterial/archaeal transporter family protein
MLIAVLITTVSWGLGGVFDKLGLDSMPDMPATSAVVVRQTMALVALGIWLSVTVSLKELRRVPASAWVYLAISGIFGVGIGGIAYFYAVQHGEISTVVVFCSGYPMLTLLLAVPFLREAVTWPKGVGTLLVVGGLVLLSVSGAG